VDETWIRYSTSLFDLIELNKQAIEAINVYFKDLQKNPLPRENREVGKTLDQVFSFEEIIFKNKIYLYI